MTQYRKIILDASALIALLNGEAGSAMVEEIIDNSIMSAVNASEVAKFLINRRDYSKQEAQDVIEKLVSDIMAFSGEQAYVAASLYAETKSLGLSMGDRACLALSKVTGYPIYTADKIWEKAQLPDINIKLIR
jgi:ribonuclease VapC